MFGIKRTKKQLFFSLPSHMMTFKKKILKIVEVLHRHPVHIWRGKNHLTQWTVPLVRCTRTVVPWVVQHSFPFGSWQMSVQTAPQKKILFLNFLFNLRKLCLFSEKCPDICSDFSIVFWIRIRMHHYWFGSPKKLSKTGIFLFWSCPPPLPLFDSGFVPTESCFKNFRHLKVNLAQVDPTPTKQPASKSSASKGQASKSLASKGPASKGSVMKGPGYKRPGF
jgi:hypothetical protein